jgi:hypothetical protein
MLNWIKRILGIGPSVPAAVEAAIPAPEEKPVKAAPKPEKSPKPKKATKKTTKKESVNFDAMSKADLLAHAKANGIKANASLKKSELVERIKSAS